VPIFLKSGSLSVLEPSGYVEACNGIALPLPLPLNIDWDRGIFCGLQVVPAVETLIGPLYAIGYLRK
jgi:hypothetical protein